MKLLFIDTETTGLNPSENGIVQIAGIVEIDGSVKERFNLKCKPFPGQKCTVEALKVIGKSIDELRSYPDPESVYKELLTIFDRYIDRYDRNDKFHMVGQNPKFDYDFLNQWFIHNGNSYFYAYVKYHLIDLVTATALFSIAGMVQVQNMKLETMTKYFGIKHEAHDALADIDATRDLFYKYIGFMKQINLKGGDVNGSIN